MTALDHQLTSVEESNNTASHNVINKNYVNESEYGSCHVEINMNGVDTSDDIESGSCQSEVKVNGIDESDVVESGSGRVKVRADDVGKSDDVIDSGSGRVRNRTANNCRDDLNVAVTTHKKMYVLSSSTLSAQAQCHSDIVQGHSDVIQGRLDIADGHSWSLHNDVDGRHSSESDSEKMEVNHESGAETVQLAADSPLYETTSDVNDRVLPTANCDVNCADDDSSHTKLALSTETKPRRDLAVRTRNGETAAADDTIIIVDDRCQGAEAQGEAIHGHTVRGPSSPETPEIAKLS